MDNTERIKQHLEAKLFVLTQNILGHKAALMTEHANGFNLPNFAVDKIHELARDEERCEDIKELLEFIKVVVG